MNLPILNHTELLDEIFAILNISHNGTFLNMVEQAQKYFLRKNGQEKWEIDPDLFQNKKELLLPLFKKLGFVDLIEPISGFYEYIVILGFVTIDVKLSFDFISKYLRSKKIECNNIVLLTSSLPLPVNSKWYQVHKTEADLMQSLYKNSYLSNYSCIFINVPMIKQDEKFRRPTTDDTVSSWLEKNPVPGKTLIVSAQPFIRRQTDIFKFIFSADFLFVPCGIHAQPNFPIALYLDELARALYQEQKLNLKY